MRGLSLFCLVTAGLYALCAMGLGIVMAASHDHSLAPVHAHLNLVGWVSVALFGIFYHLVPAAASGLLARIQVAIATLGVILLAPGIGIAVTGGTELLAIIGSLLTLTSMALFVVVVVQSRLRPA